MLVRCREPEISNGFGNQGGIAELYSVPQQRDGVFLLASVDKSLNPNEINYFFILKGDMLLWQKYFMIKM